MLASIWRWAKCRWRLIAILAVIFIGIPTVTLAAIVAWTIDAIDARFSTLSYERPTTAVDVTDGYTGHLEDVRTDSAFTRYARRLDGVRFVIVPSYLADQLMAGRELGVIDYFSDQQKWFESRGWETVIAPVDTEAPVSENGKALARFISESAVWGC